MQSPELPFLVVHGHWFWIVFVVGLAMVIGVVLLAARYAVALLRARLAISEKRRVITERIERGAAVLRGVLRQNAVEVGEQSIALKDTVVVADYRGGKLHDGDEVFASGYLEPEDAAAVKSTDSATSSRWNRHPLNLKVAGSRTFLECVPWERRQKTTAGNRFRFSIGLLEPER